MRYVKSMPRTDRAMAFVCLDKRGQIIDSGGDLADCGIDFLNPDVPVEEQILPLAQLLPLDDSAIVIGNAQIKANVFIDLHLFADSAGQWIVLFDNSEAAREKQIEQQERLSNDIIREKGRTSEGSR